MKPRGRRRSPRRAVIRGIGVVAAVALTAAACGDAERASDTPSDGGGGTAAGRPVADGAVSVADALEEEKEGPSAVRGYVISKQGLTQLCEALAESYPPQCGGRSLTLEGYDTTTMEGANEEQGVRWSSEEIVVVVERRAGRFVVVAG